MHVNCSHCGALCNVGEQLLGKQVKCGKCSKIFTAEAPAKEPAPETSGKAEKEPSPSAGSAGLAKFGSLFSGVKNVLSRAHAETGAAAADTQEPPSGSEQIDDDDLGLDFDGAGADVLDEPEEQTDAPVLGNSPAAIHGLFRLDIGSSTSTGRVRKRNEDSFSVQHHVWSNLDTRHEMALVVVADGMGGHESGEVASKMTLHHVGNSMGPILGSFYNLEDHSTRPTSYRAPLQAAIKSANSEVFNRGQSEGKKVMGCTAAVAFVWDGQVDIGHVGDCRVYHYHEWNLKQVTRDQTLVERMVELGQLTREEAKDHESRTEVTQAIGFHADIEPAFYNIKLAPGDWIIVSCDGLDAHVDYDMLADALQSAPPSAANVAHYLVDLANHHGGTDNCTVVAIRCF